MSKDAGISTRCKIEQCSGGLCVLIKDNLRNSTFSSVSEESSSSGGVEIETIIFTAVIILGF